jgi:hypothetical protein
MRWRVEHVFFAGALLAVASPAWAGPEPAPEPMPLPLIVPAIIEYRWTFLEPVWTVEPRNVDVRVVDPATRSRRIDYDIVEITMEHRRIGQVPEFDCKYFDFALPNECRTTWRAVYADVPIPVVRRDHVDVDVPDWHWRDARTTLDVPRLEWKRRELVVSLPAAAAIYPDATPAVPAPTVKEKS